MKTLKVVLVFLPFILGSAAMAADHEVQMLNKGPDGQTMWYEPAILVAEPGDTVTFVSVDKGHNSESMLVPGGAEGWTGKINDDVSVTVGPEGVYA